MTRNLSAVKKYFDTTMEYISTKDKMSKTRILYLGDMELTMAEQARENGIIPAVVYGRDQDVIDFVCANDYSIVTVENGEGTAYYTPSNNVRVDYVTDGDSISKVLASELKDESLNLVVGDSEENSLVELREYTRNIVNKVYERRNVPESIPQMKRIMARG